MDDQELFLLFHQESPATMETTKIVFTLFIDVQGNGMIKDVVQGSRLCVNIMQMVLYQRILDYFFVFSKGYLTLVKTVVFLGIIHNTDSEYGK